MKGKNLTAISQVDVHPSKPKKKAQQGTIHPSITARLVSHLKLTQQSGY